MALEFILSNRISEEVICVVHPSVMNLNINYVQIQTQK